MGFKENEQFDCCEQCEGCAIGLENRSWKANETESWKEKPECCYIVPDSEASRHNVVITRDFWLMDTPVTVAAFDVFLKKTGRALNGGAYGYDAKTNSIVWKEEFNFENPGFPDFEVSRFKQSYPASCISWKEAVDFCEWLTEEVNATEKLKGRRRFQGVLKFRLPTEAEWERACRAGTKTSYFFGDESERLPTFGNFNGFDEYDDGYDYAAPVRRFVPNGYGLCDMHGNIWEWCADWYAPYEPGLLIAAAARDPEGPFRGERRVVRGGAWNNAADSCRSATRGAAAPWVKAVNLGFRVAMDVCEY